jgi:hypothetical protein
MKLDDYYEKSCPQHDKTSCSDDEPNNSSHDGTGCRRCTAIALTKLADLERDAERDAAFLKEMQQRLQDGREKRDPTQLDMVATMIEDWLHELTAASKGQGTEQE